MQGNCYYNPNEQKTRLHFTAKLRLSEIRLSKQRQSLLYFEAVFGKNFAQSKILNASKNNSFEKVEFPLQVIFDKRTQRFSSEKITLSVFNHHKTYSQKIGILSICPSDLLNNENTTLNKEFKIEKCADKNATVKIAIELILNEQPEKEPQNQLDSSYFSTKSQQKMEQLPVIDCTRFDFLKKRSRCTLISSLAISLQER